MIVTGKKSGHTILVIAFCDIIRDVPDAFQGVAHCHTAAAAPDWLDVIIVVTEINSLIRRNIIVFQHFLNAVPLCR